MAGDFEVCVRGRSNEYSARQIEEGANFEGMCFGLGGGFCDAAGHVELHFLFGGAGPSRRYSER